MPSPPMVGTDVYRVVFEHIDEIVYCVTAGPGELHGKVQFVSNRVGAIIGYQPDDFVRDPSLWFRSLHPDDVPEVVAATARAVEERQPQMRYYRMRHGQTGEYRWFEDKIVPTTDAANRVVGYVGVGRDVTDRLRNEQRLRESEARYRALMDSGADGILAVDRNGVIAFVNQEIETMFGYERGELIGQSVETLVPECVRGVHAEMVSESLERPRSRPMGDRLDLRGRRKDGSVFPVDIDLIPIAAGGQYAVRATVRDLTERRRLEERLRQTEKIEAIGRLAGGVAHDFNNLLYVIVGSTELLMRQCPASDPKQADLKQILEAAERAASLTSRLLAFSRRQDVELTIVSVKSVIEQLEPILRRLTPERIQFAVTVADGLDPVRADRSQLEQVVLNLVLNARDAIAQAGRITISAEHLAVGARESVQTGLTTGPYVRLTVADTGTGMDAETIAHLFEPFFTTKDVGQGTGLGLATVYGIVRQAGGDVRVESTPGRGSAFSVYWPRITDRVA